MRAWPGAEPVQVTGNGSFFLWRDLMCAVYIFLMREDDAAALYELA